MSAAARYANYGWSIIPVDGTTKKPLIPSWKEFQTRRASGEEIDAWSRRFPKGGIAVICGPVSGLLVLDADGEEGASEARRRGLPKTPIARTPRGGLHAYFELPKGLGPFKNTTKIGDSRKLDIRGHASYVVAPFTKRSDGRSYEWEEKPTTKPAPVPAWFLSMLRTLMERQTPAAPSAKSIKRSGTTGLPHVGVGRVLLARLPEVVRSWVEGGHDLTRFPSRSECDFATVMALLSVGAQDVDIEEIFAAYPIGDRYREPGTGGSRYLELTIRGARQRIKMVRVKYADLNEYGEDDGRKACRRIQLGLSIEDGEDMGRLIRTGITVPDEHHVECLPRWQRFFEACGLRPFMPSEVTYATCRRLIGCSLVIEVDRGREQNQVVAFHRSW